MKGLQYTIRKKELFSVPFVIPACPVKCETYLSGVRYIPFFTPIIPLFSVFSVISVRDILLVINNPSNSIFQHCLIEVQQ